MYKHKLNNKANNKSAIGPQKSNYSQLSKQNSSFFNSKHASKLHVVPTRNLGDKKHSYIPCLKDKLGPNSNLLSINFFCYIFTIFISYFPYTEQHMYSDSNTSEKVKVYKPKYRFVKGFKEATTIRDKIRSLSPIDCNIK